MSALGLLQNEFDTSELRDCFSTLCKSPAVCWRKQDSFESCLEVDWAQGVQRSLG